MVEKQCRLPRSSSVEDLSQIGGDGKLLLTPAVDVRTQIGDPLTFRGDTTSGQEDKQRTVRREYTKDDVKELRAHSKARTPVVELAKITKRTERSLRQKAMKLGIRLGHRR
jgi:hypothetical protein